MSQFDFPRIHFKGEALIDPATANNNYHYPLVLFEPLSGTAVIPPRIYLDNPRDLEIVESEKNAISDHICYDDSGTAYLPIAGVNNSEFFKSWCTTPLGRHDADRLFHPVYAKIKTKKEGKFLLDQHPGYWNYYGTMNFELDNVTVHAVQLLKNGKICDYPEDGDIPNEVEALIGSEINFVNHRGRKVAVMIDIAPTLSIYSQVFCDFIQLKKDGKILITGKPLKASLRQMNPARVMGDPTITGASGTFCTTIALEDILKEDAQEFIKFFQVNGRTDKVLKGLFLRYDLFGIEENQYPDYDQIGFNSNPARSCIQGTIAPWYHGEMETASPGRLLLPSESCLTGQKLGSMLVHFDPGNKLLSCDAIGSLPIRRKSGEFSEFTLCDIGSVALCVLSGETELITIAEIEYVSESDAFQKLTRSGGLIDIFLPDDAIRWLESGREIRLVQIQNRKNTRIRERVLLRESIYRILSDQTGIYADQFDTPGIGYLSNRATREPCKIRIFKRGSPCTIEVNIMCAEININPYGRGEKIKIIEEFEDFKDGIQINWPTDEAGIRFYAFIPVEERVIPSDLLHYMLLTGAFVNFRVLPEVSYKASLDQSQKRKIDFQFIYDEFLCHYDLIYPASGIITPFQQGNLRKIQFYLKKLMSENVWDQYLYMPSTRDLAKGKRQLFFEWLDLIQDKLDN